MRIVICGAGEVGSHAAEVLTKDNSVTIIDKDPSKLAAIEERVDAATVEGNCARADVLLEAEVADADAVVAATECDEVNLLTATLAKKLGAGKALARVHDFDYVDREGELNYAKALGIDHLFCPEFNTAEEIAQIIRSPAAQKVEAFARGKIQMGRFTVGEKSKVLGRNLNDAKKLDGSRVVAIIRDGVLHMADASSVIMEKDELILVANSDVYDAAQKIYTGGEHRRRSVVISGSCLMAQWLCEMLRGKSFSIRLFEKDRERAEELAAELDWVTVLNADLTDPTTLESEQIAEVDYFVALQPEDERNMITGALAALNGVDKVIVVTQRSSYRVAAMGIGAHRALCPREVAAGQIQNVLDTGSVRELSKLLGGEVGVYRVRVGEQSEVVGKRLKELNLTPDWGILAVQRGESTSVAESGTEIHAADVLLVLGQAAKKDDLAGIFDAQS
ncbi:MAG: Trk system potassium transporter TrkA [Phycisphaerales bacterium]|nr:Trk system potassium transporter TrkA [Phycisphaerales bacterium]